MRDRDSVWLPARYALKVSDDRPIQIFIVKPGENTAGWAVPIQGVLTILKPVQGLPFGRSCVSRSRSAGRLALICICNRTQPSLPSARLDSCRLVEVTV
jgi:hypothetical protein